MGSAALRCDTLSSPDAPSSSGLEVQRWAGKPARLARMDRLCALALVACDGALLDAGLSPEDPSWRPERTGIVLGTTFGCHATNEAYYRGYLGAAGASPRLFAYTLPSSPVGEITIHHHILGPTSTQVGGLGAALDALREAIRHLEAGRADRMLVAAADVGSAMVARLGQPAGEDSAAALLLERGEGGLSILSTASRFSATDPEGAARRCVEAVIGSRPRASIARLFARSPLLPELPHAALAAGALSSAPLWALREVKAQRLPIAVIAVVDPAGHASAVLVALR